MKNKPEKEDDKIGGRENLLASPVGSSSESLKIWTSEIQEILKNECFCRRCDSPYWIENHSSSVSGMIVEIIRSDVEKVLDDIFVEIRKFEIMKRGKFDNSKWYRDLIEELQVLEYKKQKLLGGKRE